MRDPRSADTMLLIKYVGIIITKSNIIHQNVKNIWKSYCALMESTHQTVKSKATILAIAKVILLSDSKVVLGKIITSINEEIEKNANFKHI